MRRWLQSFDLERSAYERVEQPWVCGREGIDACVPGPTRRGRCRGQAACAPIDDGSQGGYRCARPSAEGGACAEGPSAEGSCPHREPPCRPRRSVRSRRGLVVRLTAAFTLGLLLVLLFGPARDAFVNPGDLSDPHVRLVSGCAACHGAAAGEARADDWLRWTTGHASAHDMGRRCQACHEFTDIEAPHNPHGLPPERLAAMRGEQTGGSASESQAPDFLACAACHREHKGRDQRLTAMDDGDCQGCHARPFTSFEHDHPEFAPTWPHGRRGPIAFDHKAHYGGYFAQRTQKDGLPKIWAEPDCQTCHQPGRAGHQMRPDFAAHCEPCHAAGVRYAAGALESVALRFVQFPWFDASAAPAGWPEDMGAQDPSEVAIGPVMQILLGRDRKTYVDLMGCMEPEERSTEGFLSMDEGQKEPVSAFLEAVRRMTEELGQADRGLVKRALARRMEEAGVGVVAESELDVLWPEALQAAAARMDRTLFRPDDESDEGEVDAAGPFDVGTGHCSLDLVPAYDPKAPDRQHWHPTQVAWIPRLLRFVDAQAALETDGGVDRIGAGVMKCFKCHNVDRLPDGTPTVHWHGRADQRGSRLDRFRHVPHLGQDLAFVRDRRGAAWAAAGEARPSWLDESLLSRGTGTLNCLTCHRATDDDVHVDFFSRTRSGATNRPGRTDSGPALSNFGGIRRELCASCHGGGPARSDCLACHVYHPGRRKLWTGTGTRDR